jgi:hypothetical protein
MSVVTHPPSGIDDHQICVGGEAETMQSHIHHHVDELRHTTTVERERASGLLVGGNDHNFFGHSHPGLL